MHIEFRPGEISLNEARGLVALILSLHPEAAPGGQAVMVQGPSLTVTPEAIEAVRAATTINTLSSAELDTLATNVTPPEVDAAGIPWDARIHSSGKTTVKDGTWRAKGGVSADEIARVTAELKALQGGPDPAAAFGSVPPPPPPAPVAESPAPPPPPPAAPTVAVPAGADPTTFPQLVKLLADASNAGTITQADIDACCTVVGVQATKDLVKASDKIPEFWAMIKSYIDQAG